MRKLILFIAVLTLLHHSSAFAGDRKEMWIVLLDLSGSMGVGKGTPYQKNMEELNTIINSAGKGTTIIVMGFGRRADAQLLKVEMPNVAGAMQKNLIATRESAIKKFQENMTAKAATIDRSRSDIHGAIVRSSRIFQENGTTAGRLYILSDMLENENFTLSFNRLRTEGSGKKALTELKRKGIIYPDLKGIEIYCFSAFEDVKNLKTVEVETAVRELRALWVEYFGRTGGVLKNYKTSMY
jgi:hypothetical protein